MRKYGFSALVAAGLLAGGLTASSASAADLGGNCCADLEERIAELEATTVRKGNRKVSLTLSGWVGEQIMWWDDGFEDNVYVTGLGTTLNSHFKMTGAAQISPGFSAGYVLHIEAVSSDSLTINQLNQTGPGLYSTLTQHGFAGLDGGGEFYTVQTLQSYWFLKSDHLGKVSVGLQSQASDNTAILVDGSGSLVPANWVAFDTRLFFLRDKNAGTNFGLPFNSGLTWGANGPGNCRGMGGAWGDCNGLTQTSVRYDSPTWHGFSVSSTWGADDFWDVAARYAGEWAGFKVAAAAAYNEVTDGNYNNLRETLGAPIIPQGGELTYFQAGVYVQHIPTGLWALYNYGHLDDNFSNDFNANGFTVGVDATQTHYIKAGLRERWHPLGHTVLYGEYLTSSDAAVKTGANNQGEADAFAPFNDNRLQMWGVGVVQEIDAAAMSMWLSYRHLSYDDDGCFINGQGAVLPVDCGDSVRFRTNYDDFQYIKFGALINF